MKSKALTKLLLEGEELRSELTIDTSSVQALSMAMKEQSLLAAEVALLTKYSKRKLSSLQIQEITLVAEQIKKICEEAQNNGKAIASTAKKELIKTDLPLNPNYIQLKKKIAVAQSEADFFVSLQYILNNRCDLLLELAKLTSSSLNEDTVLSTSGIEVKKSLYEKKLSKLLNLKGV